MSKQTERLKRRLAAVRLAMKDAVTPSLIKGGEAIAAAMEALAPEDSGDLVTSIEVTLPGQAMPGDNLDTGKGRLGRPEVPRHPPRRCHQAAEGHRQPEACAALPEPCPHPHHNHVCSCAGC